MNEVKRTISRRQARATKTKSRSSLRTRLIVHRSNKCIYAQIVDNSGRILAAADSSKLKDKDAMALSKQVGQTIAKLALAKKIAEVVFDRKHYKYHGRVRMVAEGARKGGLKF